mmetsp:Transcript_56140/g.114791  ORF Transcript_56140/g.114791 Transcript_56140/m.114791 type:complete len:520 (-) Transcript_56140:238-1797(-)
MMKLLVIFGAIAVPGVLAYSDVGYEKVWSVTSTENVEETCVPLHKSLSWLNGSYLLPSVAQFEIGEQSFAGSLDGYGKWHRFEFSDQGMCFQCRMLESGYYNNSVAENKIVPEMLFMDTIPSNNYSSIQKALGPNDNTLVNSLEIGGIYRTLTDFIFFLELNPYDLSVTKKFVYEDLAVKGYPLGSAHPVKRQSEECYVNVEPWQARRGDTSGLYLYQTCADDPDVRTQLNLYESEFMPYLHSWGLTANYAVIPHQSCFADLKQMLKDDTDLIHAFKEVQDDKTKIMLVPLDGSEPIAFEVDAPLYYTHVVNAFEFEGGVTFDVTAYDICPFNGGPVASLEYMRTPEQRNGHDYDSTVKRYVLWLSGDRKGEYDVTVLSAAKTSTDFTRINQAQVAEKPYCHYYAAEFFHGDPELYGSMAVVKQSLCAPGDAASHTVTVQPPVYWQKENFFPGEPTFIPRPGAVDEDDGVLLFSAVEGESFRAFLEIVDAKTMATIQEFELPTPLTFTVHGQFYPGLVD